MAIEKFRMVVPSGQVFVFVSTKSFERSNVIQGVLTDLKATIVGPQSFAAQGDRTTPDDIRHALGDLEDGECVYIIGAAGSALESHVLVPPRSEGGFSVR